MKNKKENRTFSYDSDVMAHAKKNPAISSYANWSTQRYREEFMMIENLTIKLEESIKQVNFYKESILEEKKINSSLNTFNLKQNEIFWLKNEAPKRIKRFTFEGVYKSFCKLFSRSEINRKQFKLLVDNFKREVTNE